MKKAALVLRLLNLLDWYELTKAVVTRRRLEVVARVAYDGLIRPAPVDDGE